MVELTPSQKHIQEIMLPENFGNGASISVFQDTTALSIDEELRIASFAQGVPNPEYDGNIFGRAWLAERTIHTGYIFRQPIIESVREVNPTLAALLETPTPRLLNEKPGFYEEGAVSETYPTHIPPGRTVVGYAAPRIAIELQKKYGKNPQTFDRLLNIIADSANDAITQTQFVVGLAERVAWAYVGPEKILHHLLNPKLLIEQNCRTAFREVLNVMRSRAHMLWTAYKGMSEAEKISSKIITERYFGITA